MSKKSLKVLLVEDDVDDSILIRELLAEIVTYAIEIQHCSNYSEAKTAIAEGTFDVCLIDHRLGAMTGLDLIQGADADGFKAPMILLSGYEEYELDVKAMKAGAADFMVKAVLSAPSLERAIRHAIDRFKASEDHRIQSDLIGAIIGEGIYALDIDGRVTFMNPAAERILGWTEADLIGQYLHDVIHYETPEGIAVSRDECPLLTVLVKGNTCHLADESFIHRTGARVALSCTSAPIMRNGWIVGAVFNFHDITEQKRAENERHVVTETLLAISATADLEQMLGQVREAINKVISAEHFYVALYDAAGSLDPRPAILYGLESTGTGPSELVGTSLVDYVMGRSRPTLLTKDVIGRLVKERELQIAGDVPAVWVGIPLRSPTGILGIMVLQHFTDERTYNERDLDLLSAVGAYIAQSIDGKRIERALLEAATRESSMIENALDVICTLDQDGRFIDINPACFRIWGYRPEELIGNRFIDYVDKSDALRTSSQHHKITAGENTSTFENRYVHKNGSLVDMVWTSHWSDDEQLVFAVAHDITARRQMEVELHATRDAALESARLKSEFLANMSHEIRTPMNGVVGMTELLLATQLSEEQIGFTKTIEASADSLLQIIDEILDFSKIEAGQMRFETIDFDLHEAVEIPVEAFALRAHAKGLEIASLVHSDVPMALRGDPGRLKQILTNLIGNAVKFTEQGNVFINVKQMSETPAHATVRFEIKDTGIGISEASQKQLFQPFVQADGTTTRKYGGTGLGLAISKQLVALMGGEMEMTSTLGEGSIFSFTVRFEKQMNASAAPSRSPSVGLSGLRVLIVDDTEINREVLLHQTTSWGLAAEASASAAEALKILRRSPRGFEVVIIDMMMPEINGLELARSIKADPEISHLTLILLSAYGEGGHTDAALEIGIAEVLHKPVKQSQLYNCLLKVVNVGEKSVAPVNGISKPLRRGSPATNGAAAPRSDLRILVAEDNEINLEVARHQLRALGYDAHFVHNGQEAVDAAKRDRYDLILMDCQMPEKDGFEATAEIRALEGVSRHTTIVAVTAHALDGDREKCLAAGMDDYLGKPVKIDALKKLLEEWTPEGRDEPEWPEELSVAKDDNIVDQMVLASYEDLQQPGEPDLVIKLIDLFMDTSSASLICLKRAANAGDMAEVLRLAHGLKGSAGNIGASQMATISTSIEMSKGLAAVQALGAKLETAFEKTGEILATIKDQRQKGETQ